MECNNIGLYEDLYFSAQGLTHSEIFQERRLSLFCSVPFSDLAAADGRTAPPPQDGRITLLVCQGDTALLAANLARKDQAPPTDGIPGLLTLELQDRSCYQAAEAIEEALKGLLGKDLSYPCRFLGRLIPPGQLEELSQAQLVRIFYDQEEPVEMQPTDYGFDCGLVYGYTFSDSGSLETGVWCSEQTDANLEKILAQISPKARTSRRIPLEERLSQPSQKPLARDVEAVRRFADRRLDDYLKDFPETLAEVRRCLPMLGPDATYQDAAVIVYWLLQNEAEHPKRVRQVLEKYPEAKNQSGLLLGHLAKPLFSLIDVLP